ncbi:MAG: trypsin-like peptidase domain-containing protein [Deltaproteobacteria bacterium]|nr:trypsin-like peptidase domain-containing protein [Deltaproteobacteria bacterium]MBW1794555.1 trypsin-like peptidase domain-containing protein [Deltaproteobacteria bacterium]
MNRFKEFLASYLTGLLSILLVLNVIIVLFAFMGIGWQQMLQVPTYVMEALQDPSRLLSRWSTTVETNHPIRKTSGVVAGSNIQLVCSDETFAAAVSRVRPAVVNISCESIGRAQEVSGNLQFDDPAQDLLNVGGIGSGIIIDPRGYILTCYHLISRASNITVTPFGYEVMRYRARLIAKDEGLNLAVLRINTANELPAATLGDSAQMEVADVVLAIGSPFGLEQSVTHGIVSDDHRDLQIGARLYREMMQTDVPINRGSSGGPLININGEVIAINMAIYSPTGVYSGVSFAMPINQAKTFLARTIQ